MGLDSTKSPARARRRKRGRGWVLLLALLPSALVLSTCRANTEFECTEEAALELYEARIQPIFSDEHPASCGECHLSGVDFTLFARDTPCETMACLVELNLVDLNSPDDSQILDWIERARPTTPGVKQNLMDQELSAIQRWIHYNASCGGDVCAGVTCEPPDAPETCAVEGEPPVFDVVAVDGCSERALEQSFRDTVYRWRGRCYPCHFTTTKPFEDAPKWLEANGRCDLASLTTMRNVIDSGYVSTHSAESSMFLLKPLAEDAGGLEHGGHDKFHPPDDRAYLAWLHWLNKYASCR